MKKKRLFKSAGNKILAGVFGGLGTYFDVDPTVLRLFFLVIVVLTGFFPGVLFYFMAAFIVPKKE